MLRRQLLSDVFFRENNMEQYILSIDAGTTSARCIIFDKQGNVRAMKQRELHMVYPHDGWVEQSAREIWEVQRTVCQEAIAALAIRPEQIAAISSFSTLLPGDVIMTGTPNASGHLDPGDETIVHVEGIGDLRNVIVRA